MVRMTERNDATTDGGAPEATPSSATSDAVTREMTATPEQVFAVLTDPSRHHEMDAVAMVQRPLTTEHITHEGQVFTMAMQRRMGRDAPLEDYVMDNHVTVFDAPNRIRWEPAPQGAQPLGWSWTFDVEATPGGSRVTQTYDWSDVTDPQVKAQIPFPAIARKYREASLAKLEQAAERG